LNLKGTVVKRDLEGETWVLETKKGETYQLKGGPVDLYQNGLNVNLRGNVKKDLMGFGMTGPIFEVQKML